MGCDAFLLNWKDFNSIFLFPPFKLVSPSVVLYTENQLRKAQRLDRSPKLAGPSVVSESNQTSKSSSHSRSFKTSKSCAKKQRQSNLAVTFIKSNLCPLLRNRIKRLGVNKVMHNYLMNARMPNLPTLKSYDLQERKWMTYCLEKDIDCENPKKRNILEFHYEHCGKRINVYWCELFYVGLFTYD